MEFQISTCQWMWKMPPRTKDWMSPVAISWSWGHQTVFFLYLCGYPILAWEPLRQALGDIFLVPLEALCITMRHKGWSERGVPKSLVTTKMIFLKCPIQQEKIFFDPNLTRPKLFQTGLNRNLRIVRAFAKSSSLGPMANTTGSP